MHTCIHPSQAIDWKELTKMHDKINLKQVKISQREKHHSMKKKPLQLFKKLHIQGDTYAALYSSEGDQEEKIKTPRGEKFKL